MFHHGQIGFVLMPIIGMPDVCQNIAPSVQNSRFSVRRTFQTRFAFFQFCLGAAWLPNAHLAQSRGLSANRPAKYYHVLVTDNSRLSAGSFRVADCSPRKLMESHGISGEPRILSPVHLPLPPRGQMCLIYRNRAEGTGGTIRSERVLLGSSNIDNIPSIVPTPDRNGNE